MEKSVNTYNIMKGTIILSIGVLISRILGFAYRIPIRHILGDEGNGLYGEAYQLYLIILTLTAIAIPGALSKLIAEKEALSKYHESERIFKISIKYSLIAVSILGLVVIFCADMISDISFPNDHLGGAIRIFASTAIIATGVASLRGYFQGLGNMKPTAISQILEQFMNVLFSVALAYQFSKVSLMGGVIGSCLGTTIGAITALMILLIIYFRVQEKRKKLTKQKGYFKQESEKAILRKIIKIVLPVIITTSVFSIMTYLDYSMLANMLPKSLSVLKEKGLLHLVPIKNIEALDIPTIIKQLKGQYSFQYNTFINIPVSLILQSSIASIPAIAIDTARGNDGEVKRKVEMILRGGLLLAVPASIAFVIFGVPLMHLILGQDATGGELLSLGGTSLIAITIAQLTAGILQGVGKASISSKNAIIACSIKVIFNFILISIPELNIYSVVLSTTICYIIYSILNVVSMYKEMHIHLKWRIILLKPIVYALGMGGLSYVCYETLRTIIPNQRICMLITIPIAMVIYFIIGIITKTITKEDLRAIGLYKKGYLHN